MKTPGICEIGRFYLGQYTETDGKPVVWIGILEGDGAGEGGTFPLAEIEKLIADYYRENF